MDFLRSPYFSGRSKFEIARQKEIFTCGTVTKFSRYFQPFLMEMDGSREIPQQIMDVAEVTARSSLRRTVTNFNHQSHVLLVVLDGLLK